MTFVIATYGNIIGAILIRMRKILESNGNKAFYAISAKWMNMIINTTNLLYFFNLLELKLCV